MKWKKRKHLNSIEPKKEERTNTINAVWFPVTEIKENEYNPNIQSDTTFNNLVQNIREVGQIEPIIVVKKPKFYEVVGGEHRFRACKVLGFEKVWCVVVDWDEDMQKFQNMRFNILRGRIDPEKFLKLYENLSKKYSADIMQEMMMFESDVAMKELLKSVKKELPEELREKLEKTKQQIQNIDDLSLVLNKLFTEFGDSLEFSYMFFVYSGKINLMIQMDEELKNLMEGLTSQCQTEKKNINQVLKERLMKRS